MFSNLNWYNVLILLLLALFIFGDKLPQMISDGLRMVRNLRRMAQNATTDLSRELGTDIRLEDLHPKAFVRKHLLSEADQEKLLQPLKSVSDDVVRQTRGLESELKDVGREVKDATGTGRRNGTGRGAGTRSRAARTGRSAAASAGAAADVGDGQLPESATEPTATESTATGAQAGAVEASHPARGRLDDIT